MNSIKKICFLMLFAFFFIAGASTRFEIVYKTDVLRFEQQQVIQLVSDALDLSNSQSRYSEVNVFIYSKQAGAENYFVVNLHKPNSYSITSYRLDISNASVVKVTKDYVEEEPLDPGVCGTCPDPEVEVLVCYITQFTSCKPNADKVVNALIAAKIKHALLIDNQENKTSILNYLSCPKLKVYGRIGHGYAPGSIGLGKANSGVSLTTKDITTAPFKDLVKGKTFPLNSCEVGGNNNTFGKGLISSGAKWMYAGDDCTIYAGSSEPVWANFMIDVCTKKAEIIATYTKYMTNAQDKYRYQTSGPAPLYVFEATGISGSKISEHNSTFSISTNSQSITFNAYPGTLSVYSITGKLLYQNTLTSSPYIWDMKAHDGAAVNSGNYIAVVNDGDSKNTMQPFIIAR